MPGFSDEMLKVALRGLRALGGFVFNLRPRTSKHLELISFKIEFALRMIDGDLVMPAPAGRAVVAVFHLHAREQESDVVRENIRKASQGLPGSRYGLETEADHLLGASQRGLLDRELAA